VLLSSGIDRTKPEIPPWWFPVGGGIEANESPEEAAIRETFEETGLVISDPGDVVYKRRFDWDFLAG
jgi:8-oxo-dGTP pyrophosphatase MutT (NUDIX family)